MLLKLIVFVFARQYDLRSVEHDATLEYLKFICKDFMISTSTANIGYVTKSGTKVDVITLAKINYVCFREKIFINFI